MKTTLIELDKYLRDSFENRADLAKYFNFKSVQALQSWVARGNVPHYHQARVDLYFEKLRRKNDGNISTKKSREKKGKAQARS